MSSATNRSLRRVAVASRVVLRRVAVVGCLLAALGSLWSCGRKSKLEEGRMDIHNRAVAREDSINQALSRADSLLVVTRIEVDSLRALLTVRQNPVGPYMVVKGSTLPQTGLEARLDDVNSGTEAVFYLVAKATGKGLNFTQIGVARDASGPWVMSETVARDGEQNDVYGGAQTVHFMGAQTDSIGETLSQWGPNAGGYVLFRADNGRSFTAPLSAADVSRIAIAYRYSQALRNLQIAARDYQRLERLLETARQHVARTMPDTVSGEK